MGNDINNLPLYEMQTITRESPNTPEGRRSFYKTTVEPAEVFSANDIHSLPASVRQHLEAAAQPVVQQEAAQDQLQEAATMFRAAGLELAKSHPELFTILMLGSMGYEGISFKETEQVPQYTGLGKLIAAVAGRNPDDLITVRETTRTIRLLK